MPDLKSVMEYVKSEDNKSRISLDYQRYLAFNGHVRSLVEQAIRAEFILPQTINEMINRIVPLNITDKIITKLAQVYKEPPIRRPKDKNEADQELIDMYSDAWEINRKGKFANRMFKLHKHVMYEPFLSSKGIPQLRVLPSQTYTVFSDDPIDPTCPTTIVKHLIIDQQESKNNRFSVWTDEEAYIVDDDGKIMGNEMAAIGADGRNPYGVLPFSYIKECEDRLVPISDDDLIRMQLIINLFLTDLAFASKYQTWAIICLIGADSQNLSFNPNSIVSLPEGAKLETVQPKVDINGMLQQITYNMDALLSSKGLATNNTGESLSAGSAASGISKVLDKAETTELREDQVEFFRQGEEWLWWKFAHNILPVWVNSGEMDPEYVNSFSPDFELSITFPDIKPKINEMDMLNGLAKKLELGLITKKMAVQQANPGIDMGQVDELINELNKENLDAVAFMDRNAQDNNPPDGTNVNPKV